MKLKAIGVERVQEAIRIFLEIAWEGEPPRKPTPTPVLDVDSQASMAECLALFTDESNECETAATHRYILRLGSRNYPFMKFVLQEYFFEGEYFFVVDTHDQMELRPTLPDYDAWLELKRINQQIKSEIELRWKEAELPTVSDLSRLCSSFQSVRSVDETKTILIVDDERAIADTVSALLEARGYTTLRVYDGQDALDLLETIRPDLILLDYEMPHLDGVQLAECIKTNERTADIPVLLATACSMDLSEISRADGFLVKPFQKDILFMHIAHLLKK